MIVCRSAALGFALYPNDIIDVWGFSLRTLLYTLRASFILPYNKVSTELHAAGQGKFRGHDERNSKERSNTSVHNKSLRELPNKKNQTPVNLLEGDIVCFPILAAPWVRHVLRWQGLPAGRFHYWSLGRRHMPVTRHPIGRSCTGT